MLPKFNEIPEMLDVSCVYTNSNINDITQLVQNAKKYRYGHISVLQCYIPYVKELLKYDPEIKVCGNVSFPSGSDSTSLKIIQAGQLVDNGCDEIDMVMNVGWFLSGKYADVEKDINAVVQVSRPLPVKVIIEVAYLNHVEIEKACKICLSAGAAFIKTGTGWTQQSTTLEHIKLIKEVVGNAIEIKASGGIKDLSTLMEMYKLGARRFGINLTSAIKILEECTLLNGDIA